tara:strand:- start:1 stop:888 length:888 start_codon:yes stop_codon:yes gene_type:complete
MKRKATKIIELVISDESQELTIDAISLVTSPAIEQDFVFFGKDKNNLTLAKIDEEKRMLVSPALIPNKQIFRYDPNTDSNYYVYFSKETVRQASELYLKHNNHHKATYQHEDRVSGVLTIESWIKEGDMDKSKMFGFDLPDGTWFVKMKIENDEMWNKIKDGELKGLSIEGYFINKMEKMGKQQFSNEEIREAIKELLSVQKVELGLVDDADKKANEVKKVTADFIKEINTFEKAKDNLKSSLKGRTQQSINLLNTIKDIDKAAKDLGIKIPTAKYEKVLDEYYKIVDRVDNLLK